MARHIKDAHKPDDFRSRKKSEDFWKTPEGQALSVKRQKFADDLRKRRIQREYEKQKRMKLHYDNYQARKARNIANQGVRGVDYDKQD